MRIGLVSDTHDLLRPEARAFLAGSDHLLHAGDICGPAVLAELATLGPLTAVRGNNDIGDWARELDERVVRNLGGALVLVLHDLTQVGRTPLPPGLRVVVSGHTHRPKIEERGGVLYVNPGSAGPRRFRLPVTVGELTIAGGTVSARTVELVTV